MLTATKKAGVTSGFFFVHFPQINCYFLPKFGIICQRNFFEKIALQQGSNLINWD